MLQGFSKKRLMNNPHDCSLTIFFVVHSDYKQVDWVVVKR
jgi:hypothetical protein